MQICTVVIDIGLLHILQPVSQLQESPCVATNCSAATKQMKVLDDNEHWNCRDHRNDFSNGVSSAVFVS